jgi:hypothetical protein
MALEEFEIDGKKVVINNEFNEKETGVAILDREEDDEFEKTMEVEPIDDEEYLSNTLTDIFGEENHE